MRYRNENITDTNIFHVHTDAVMPAMIQMNCI